MNPPRITLWTACELGALVLAAVLAWWLFELHNLDIEIVRMFYAPHAGGWPLANAPWVWFVNQRAVTILVVCCATAGVLLWTLGHLVDKQWRFAGMFIVLSLAIGPGLVVNGILKAHWGRARPADIIQFGGKYHFRHVSDPGPGGRPEDGGDGRSFPSGHASAAFWTTAFYLLARRKRRRLAVVLLCASLALGVVVSAARIVAGRHFPSDVVWAGIIAFGVNWLVYHALLLRPPSNWSWLAARQALGARLAVFTRAPAPTTQLDEAADSVRRPSPGSPLKPSPAMPCRLTEPLQGQPPAIPLRRVRPCDESPPCMLHGDEALATRQVPAREG